MMRKYSIVTLACFNIAVCHANISNELGNFVNNLGITSNVTNSSTYQTQAAGMVSLGSISARNQVRNLQLAQVDVPSFRSGCGGIDITAGGFSFIKAPELIKFSQNILSDGAGYAFNLALETELPTIAHSLQYVQSLANNINSTNMNSCAIGESLVGGLWSKNRAAQQQICQDLGKYKGTFRDWAQARQQCSTGGEIDKQLEAAKKDKEFKDRVLVNTNIVWDVLQKNSFLSSDKKLAEAYMSISGTIIFDKKGAMTTYPSLVTNRDFIKAMMYGGKIPVYSCKDSGSNNKCINISNSDDQYQLIDVKDALVTRIQSILIDIYNKIRKGEALSSEQVGIISMTQASVFRLISANAEQGIGLQGGYELAQNVAAELLSQFLNESLAVVRGSLAGKDLGKENENILFGSLNTAQKHVSDFSNETRGRFNQALETNRLIQDNVKQAIQLLAPVLRPSYKGDA